MFENTDYTYELIITNKTLETIKEINISSTDEGIIIYPEIIEDFEETATITITINSAKDISGKIILSANKSRVSIPVEITITKNESKVEQNFIGDFGPAKNDDKRSTGIKNGFP